MSNGRSRSTCSMSASSGSTAYPMLERERLTNSILELYDFVLGSLLAAEMTQKQSVIFRYVTRLMLHIPDATIHTLRELMEKDSEIRFAEHIAKLQRHGAALLRDRVRIEGVHPDPPAGAAAAVGHSRKPDLRADVLPSALQARPVRRDERRQGHPDQHRQGSAQGELAPRSSAASSSP